MKTLNFTADIASVGIGQHGEIICEVLITYRRISEQSKRQKIYHKFNLTQEMRKWEK